jgi:hypothetical protein
MLLMRSSKVRGSLKDNPSANTRGEDQNVLNTTPDSL